MQERYLGDSHDFIKYALLRHLHWTLGVTIGVNWYLTKPDDVDASSNKDGEKRHHLRGGDWERWDPELFQSIRQFSDKSQRRIASVEKAGILPSNTIYFEELVSRDGRNEWHNRARSALSPTDLVFLDPDNGFEIKSMTRKSSPKYAMFAEAADYYRAGKIVVGIQFARQCDPIQRAKETKAKLDAECGAKNLLSVVRGRVAPNILFISLAPSIYMAQMASALRSFADNSSKVELIE